MCHAASLFLFFCVWQEANIFECRAVRAEVAGCNSHKEDQGVDCRGPRTVGDFCIEIRKWMGCGYFCLHVSLCVYAHTCARTNTRTHARTHARAHSHRDTRTRAHKQTRARAHARTLTHTLSLSLNYMRTHTSHARASGGAAPASDKPRCR